MPRKAPAAIRPPSPPLRPRPQLWDLRNSVSPIREFHGHAKGVLGMSWCPQDSSFLLSSAKDNRTICWDVNAGAPCTALRTPRTGTPHACCFVQLAQRWQRTSTRRLALVRICSVAAILCANHMPPVLPCRRAVLRAAAGEQLEL